MAGLRPHVPLVSPPDRARAVFVLVAVAVLAPPTLADATQAVPPERRTVTGRMQPAPGAPMQEVEVAIHQVPTNLPLVAADQARLEAEDLVLGLVIEGEAVAYPVRYLALFEVVNTQIASRPIAPTW